MRHFSLLLSSFILLFSVLGMQSINAEGANPQWKTTIEITNTTALANSCPGAESSYTSIMSTICLTMPNGSLIAFVWAKYSGTGDFSPQDVFIFRSYDNGLTWTSPQMFLDNITDVMVYNGSGVQNGNDGIGLWVDGVVAGNRTWVAISAKPTTCTSNTGKTYNFLRYSDDNGSTWSQLINITDECDLINRYDNYHFIASVGNSIYLKNGRLVFPGWFYNQSHSNYDLFAIYTDDPEDGLNATFNTTSAFGTTQEFSEWSIVQLENYTLYGTVRDGAKAGGPAYRFSTWSTDNGSTWTDPAYLDTSLLDPESKGSIIRYTTDKEYAKNRILLAWNNDSTNRNHLTVAVSYDECQTFSVRRELGNGLEYPFLCVTANNSIICTYRHGTSGTVADIDIFNLEWLSNGADYLDPVNNTSISDTEYFGISLPIDYTASSPSNTSASDIEYFGISLPIDYSSNNNGSGFIISNPNNVYITVAGLAVFFPFLGLIFWKARR